MTMTADLEFYATPGPMTATATIDPVLFDGLPTSASGLCGVSTGLFVHEYLASMYGVTNAEQRTDELERRTIGELIDVLVSLDGSRPLREPRSPGHRAIGNCRQFSLMTCALLRRAGIPARVRAGFADYFGSDTWTDHWIIERWDADRTRWVRTDPQLDEIQQEQFGYTFDPMHVPPDRFLTGAEAWQRCRRGDDSPQRFGIMDMRGLWFIAGSVIRDLAALNKVETHVWDIWGVMEQMLFTELTQEQRTLVDRIAQTIVTGSLADIRQVYDTEAIRVPGAVTSHRFGHTIAIEAAA
jgi:hypothetical protein